MIKASRNRIAGLLAVVTVLLASFGGLATANASTHAAKKKAPRHHVKKPTVKKKGCIPQTSHNTDNDPDNHGGPNDGDGCV